jgi:hypothetical protein
MRIKPKHPRNAMRKRIKEREKEKRYQVIPVCYIQAINRFVHGSIGTYEQTQKP